MVTRTERMFLRRRGVVQIGAGADWWFDCYVNGKLVYTTAAVNGTGFEGR